MPRCWRASYLQVMTWQVSPQMARGDTRNCHAAGAKRGAHALILPRRNATLWKTVIAAKLARTGTLAQRDIRAMRLDSDGPAAAREAASKPRGPV